LQEAQVMVEDASIMIYQQWLNKEEDTIYFDLKKFNNYNFKSYLYQWLKFEFTAWRIYDLVESQSGKSILLQNIVY
jgi:tRNA(Ile)-lysidine synthase